MDAAPSIRRASLILWTSAAKSGPVTTARQERFHIFANLDSPNLDQRMRNRTIRGSSPRSLTTFFRIDNRRHVRETRGVKRSNPDSEPSLSSSLVSQNDSDDDEIGGLKALGYMPGHAHFGLSGVDCEV